MTELAWMKTYIGTETALTGHLTPEEFGAYERLRRHYWQHAKLPDDDARLVRIAGAEPDRWPALADAILPLLAEALPKLDGERSQAANKREKKVAAGRKGAEARWHSDGGSNADANGKDMADAMANPMRNQWPSASASEEVRLGGKEVLTRTHARETEPTEYPIDPPETLEEGRAYLQRRGVPEDAMNTELTKLMNWRLYRADLEGYQRSDA